MTADIFALLQSYTKTQTVQPANQETPSDGENIQPGLFASLMNECIADAEGAENPLQMLVLPEEVSEPQTMAFTGTNAFPQSVMNILAGEPEAAPETESPETTPLPEDGLPSPETADDDDSVIWPDDEAAMNPEDIPAGHESRADRIIARVKNLVQENSQGAELTDSDIQEIAEQVISEEGVDALPEELLRETAQAVSEIAAELKHEDGSDTQPVVRILDALTGRIAPKDSVKAPDDTEDPQESEQPQEIPEASTELAGLAGVTNPQPQPAGHPEIQDAQTQPEQYAISSQPSRQRRTQPETQQVPHEHQETPESQEVSTNFREALVNRNADPENSGQENPESQTQNQNQNQSQSRDFSQGRNDSGTGNSSSRQRSDSRRVDSRTQSAGTDSQPSPRRTESHSDFAAYFEGVLNSRRSTARTSQPMPLNLRTAENFTQASALRDGITNVVRFIRADGVQKARVIVDPPALGRVSVELTSGTSGVEASIKVASEQIRQLVQDQISQLRMNLSQQGVQVAEFTVDVQQDNSGSQGQQGQQQNTGRFGFIDDSEDDEAEDFRIDLEDGLLYWVA